MASNAMCNDCYLSNNNCHDRSICCEMEEYEGKQCEWFEPLPCSDYCVNFRIVSVDLKCPYCGHEQDSEYYNLDVADDYKSPLQYDKINAKIRCEKCQKMFRLGIQKGAVVI